MRLVSHENTASQMKVMKSSSMKKSIQQIGSAKEIQIKEPELQLDKPKKDIDPDIAPFVKKMKILSSDQVLKSMKLQSVSAEILKKFKSYISKDDPQLIVSPSEADSAKPDQELAPFIKKLRILPQIK
eukprot:TRINITY_DN3625_c0_g1_i1.p1 TRINITY_DN3625_c0_g1~~TRINITY_DN3625_c0_g1_i1.p1  ORF type:complete len:137 (-),score=33.31 TRINITY_DN3625_c0_g1_i1:222-605(-)